MIVFSEPVTVAAAPVDLEALPDIPTHVPYLLIGAGTASFGAFRSIKAADPKAKARNLQPSHHHVFWRVDESILNVLSI